VALYNDNKSDHISCCHCTTAATVTTTITPTADKHSLLLLCCTTNTQGRDVGVSQITGFTAKISMGNGMQARSREVARLAQQLDFPRLLTFYYSSVGGFLTQCFLVRDPAPPFCDRSAILLLPALCNTTVLQCCSPCACRARDQMCCSSTPECCKPRICCCYALIAAHTRACGSAAA
jgi:1,3-beta-glucan synthase component